MEEWKTAFESYEISNFGNCRRKLKNGTYREIKGSLMTTPSSKTYTQRYFQTQQNGKRTNHLFSHLVAKCFIGERPDGLVIDHIDQNPHNNHYTNLRYITPKENSYNSARVKDVPINTPDRRRIIQVLWENDNKEIISEKRRLYYEKNKDKMEIRNEQRRNDRVVFVCSHCNMEISIQKRSLKVKKGSMCSLCTSLYNLP